MTTSSTSTSPTTESTPAAKRQNSAHDLPSEPAHRTHWVSPHLGTPFVLLAMIILFSVLKPTTFATGSNAATIAQSQMVLVIVALGSLLPLIVGEFDLSVGYNACTTSLIAASLVGSHVNIVLTTVIALGVATLVGIFNAIIIVGIGVNSFIVTLGSGTILGGLDLYISGGQTLYSNIPAFLTKIGAGYLFGIPLDISVALVITLAVLYVLRATPLGRAMYATGAGREASRLAGVPTGKIRAGAMVASAIAAGIAGLLELGLVGSASVTIGPDFLLPALAACYLGSTLNATGRFNVVGTVVAIFLIAVGVTGLEQMGVPSWVEPLFDGGALIAAVVLTVVAKRVRTGRPA